VPEKQVLEVGCGRGGFTHFWRLKGQSLRRGFFPPPLSRQPLRDPKATGLAGGSIDWVQPTPNTCPYDDRAFDVVISCEMIEHLPDPVAALARNGSSVPPRRATLSHDAQLLEI